MRKIRNPWQGKSGYDCFGCSPDNPLGVIDECASWVVFRKLQTTGVTTKLDVRYRKPIMTTDAQLTIRAVLRGMRRNLAQIGVTIENSMGEVCTEGEATYFTFPAEKARQMGFTSCDTEGDELLSM